MSVNFGFSATPPRNVKDIPEKETIKRSTYVIIMVLTLLVFLILITLIVFYVMYVRRRNFKKQGNSHCSIRVFTIKVFLILWYKVDAPKTVCDPYFYPVDFCRLQLLPCQICIRLFNTSGNLFHTPALRCKYGYWTTPQKYLMCI